MFISPQYKRVMVNLGCGPIGHKEWINLDYGILALLHRSSLVSKILYCLKWWPKSIIDLTNKNSLIRYDQMWPQNLHYVDCTKNLPFKDNSVDFIFTSHFLEHIPKFKVLQVLRSCYRCLKFGGTIRIIVPNLDFIIQQYAQEQDDIRKVDIINDHFFAGLPQTLLPLDFIQKIQAIFVRPHHWMYNYDYLKMILIEAKFVERLIVRCHPGCGKVPNLNYLDCHEEESIFVEATK